MSSPNGAKRKARTNGLQKLKTGIENDPSHHFAGPFLPQTPLGSPTPTRSSSPAPKYTTPRPVSPWLRWAIVPTASLFLLFIPPVLATLWQLIVQPFAHDLPNPFTSFFLLSHRVPESTSQDPRYAKGYCDLLFIAYYIVFWSLMRQIVAANISRRIARWFGLKKEAKLDRFGEQGYAVFYFTIFGAWGYRIMGQLPTWWYQTEYFWIDYPHWDMKPELKRYYLMQAAYWCQQLIVLVLRLEKPRKDYKELVAHHFVTLWLVGWSYFINLTLIGNAVYMSMDIPDTFLAFSKILNYIQWERAKVVSFVIFFGIWTYFRHYLNLWILWSVWNQFDYVPLGSRQWSFENGTYLPHWMQYQVFVPILLLQCLNLFWYYLMVRILVRALTTNSASDDRSDDEDDGEEETKKKN